MHGLTTSEAALRLERDGPNELEMTPPPSPWRIFLNQFANLMVLILLFAGAVAGLSWWLDGAHGVPGDALTIFVIVIFNAILGFAQEYRAERTLQELKRTTTARAHVWRDGQLAAVERAELVVGDCVQLGEGDRVPADLVVLEASRLQIDESVLTGESLPLERVPGEEVFAGTTVTNGTGLAEVRATGSRTRLGGIAKGVATAHPEPTPLERSLDQLGRQIGWGVLAVSVVVGLTVALVQGTSDRQSLVHILLFAVALAVAAVPEGLPAVLTVSLSVGARRLARRNAVVRRMAAVETLGSVTCIVTDKTGTLTCNQMTVRGASSSEPELLRAAVLANGASLDESGKALGDPTDAAFLHYAVERGLDWRALRALQPVLQEAPFSSQRRRMSTLHADGDGFVLYCKGSLETILERSQGGAEVRDEYSAQGLRTLAVACRRLDQRPTGDLEDLENELTILGTFGLGDPPRPEAADAVRDCRQAGIQVYMLTGDHPETAEAVGRAVGIEGAAGQMGEWTDAELDERLRDTRIWARMLPGDKLRVVDRLLARGEVLAMTGDGVNDAPALKRAHVGVAMGKSGTAVAVEASDLVLLDDNFATIVRAIREGRGVYANVQRFIAFLFSGNLGVVLAMFLGSLLAGLFNLRTEAQLLLPLTAAQILWMNLVTDGAPAVAFSFGRCGAEAMLQPPRRPTDPLLSARQWRFVFGTGLVVCALLLLVLDATFAGGVFTVFGGSSGLARSMGFYTVVTARLWNAFNFRTGQEVYVPAACLLSWVMTLVLLQLPLAHPVFQLEPLSLEQIACLTVVAATIRVGLPRFP